MTILAIETSCDETAVGIVKNQSQLLAQKVLSQIELHDPYGGIVPEIAARSHLEAIIGVIDQALNQARLGWPEIDALAVTYGPGLAGSLLVGVTTAQTLALSLKKPLYAINHVEGHVYANFLTSNQLELEMVQKVPDFPLLALIISGKHSQLALFSDHGRYKLLGQAIDDAIGEAFDKAGRLLGLPYPGGPAVAKIALKGDRQAYKLPIAQVSGDYDFSFSGLKTALLRQGQKLAGGDHRLPSQEIAASLSRQQVADLAASFETVAIKTVIEKTKKAFWQYQPKSLVIAGGVAANSYLRQELRKELPLEIEYCDPKLCTDNGAMIAALASYLIASQKIAPIKPTRLAVSPSLLMTGQELVGF